MSDAKLRELSADEEAAYKAGFLDGIQAYAWNKNGQQFVGTTGRTLQEASRKVEETWNYYPRKL